MQHTIHRFVALDSTMTKAAELAAAGAPDGTVVVADTQTAGQGRLGRSWHSEPCSGLYFTLLFRPALPPSSLPIVTMALGVGVSGALRRATGAPCDLRWPNDVLLRDRKCAGILTQLHGSVLLAGVGINVNHTSFPSELARVATSLRIETGRPHDRDGLLTVLLGSIDDALETLFRGGKDAVLRAFEAGSTYVRGRRVIVDETIGTTDGLDPQGFLWLRRDDGRRTLVVAGGVRPAPEP